MLFTRRRRSNSVNAYFPDLCLEGQNLSSQAMCGMEYIAVLNSYLEYSLDDSHTVNLSFQSTNMHVFHAAESMKCRVTF